ncbi:MAG TPA: hypothetical protein VJP79_03150 [Nitrososphaera sp.]|nr:hypothetical protein [Nitrososphaera sp.]
MSQSSEQLRCNICGLAVSSSDAKVHSSTSLHATRKHELERDLEAVRNEQYANDSSVVLQWKSSV